MTPVYTADFEAEVQAWAEARIPEKRLPHVRGVVMMCDTLAQRYAPTEQMRVRLAGWIHDSAKHMDPDTLLQLAEAHQLPITASERTIPSLLHGAVGYVLAAEAFGLDDPLLQSACAFHTTGDVNMNTTDKIVFLGDLIEPTRDFPGVMRLRAEADHDLDVAILLAVDHTLQHLIRKQRYMDPRPVALRNRLIAAGVAYENHENDNA